MSNLIQYIKRGLPGHPGTIYMVIFLLLGLAAGAPNGVMRALLGAGLMAAVFGPIYLWGAWERGKEHYGEK